MRAFGLATDEGMVEVDVCHSCEQVWFDHQELEKVSKFFDVPFAQNLPGDVAEELSKIRMEAGQAVPQHTVFDFSTSDFGFQVGFEHMKKLGRKAGLAFWGFPLNIRTEFEGYRI